MEVSNKDHEYTVWMCRLVWGFLGVKGTFLAADPFLLHMQIFVIICYRQYLWRTFVSALLILRRRTHLQGTAEISVFAGLYRPAVKPAHCVQS